MNVKHADTKERTRVGKMWADEIMRIKETERENLTGENLKENNVKV
jgi:hypothetical protein